MKILPVRPRRMWMVYVALLVVFLLALSPILLRSAQAAKPATPQPAPAIIQDSQNKTEFVKIGVYVMSVGALDMLTGSYKMDFYLSFKCPKACDPSKFDIMNAQSFEWEDQTGDNLNGTFYSYRVRADLLTELDLRHYPFDSHELPVKIEDKQLTTDKLVFVPDEKLSGIDENVVVSGWQLSPVWYEEVVDHDYTIFGESYSRYRFYVTIHHPWFASFMKGLFAAIVIVMVGMLSFLMRYNEISERLALTTSTLVGAILYHLTLTSSIPPVGYLTFADEFMIINYVIIFAALFVTIMLMWYVNEGNRDAEARRLHERTRWVIPGAWVVLMIVVPAVEFWPSIVKHLGG